MWKLYVIKDFFFNNFRKPLAYFISHNIRPYDIKLDIKKYKKLHWIALSFNYMYSIFLTLKTFI